MTLTDFIIVFVTTIIVCSIIYKMIKSKEDDSCNRCSYAKKK